MAVPSGSAGGDQTILEAFDSGGATGESRHDIADLQAQLAAFDTPRAQQKTVDILQALFLQDAPSFAGVIRKIADIQAQLGFSDNQATGFLLKKIQDSNLSTVSGEANRTGDLLRKIQDSNFNSANLEPNRDGDILRRMGEIQVLLAMLPQGPFENINNQRIRPPGITIDGGGSVPATGSKGTFTFPYSCAFANWYLSADQSGSCVIDVKRSGASIVGGGGNKPTLSSAQNGNAAVAGWTSTAISAGDILEYNLDSVTTLTRVTLVFKANAS